MNATININSEVLNELVNKAFSRLYRIYLNMNHNDEKRFNNYLKTTFQKCSSIKPIGFRDPIDFFKIYIPLTLEKKNYNGYCIDSFCIDSFPRELLEKNNHILIIDNAGMGKSTISKRLFMSVYQFPRNKYEAYINEIKDNNKKKKAKSNGEDGQNNSEDYKKSVFGIPIFIELRKLNRYNTIINQIRKHIESFSESFSENALKFLLEHGKFIFILDGYDEILHEEKPYVATSLLDFIDKLPHSIFIITSRQDESLSAFDSFSQYSIKGLCENEAYQLICNLDDNGEKSKALITALQKGNSGIEEFLTNPLLVTLLFATYEYNTHLPDQKHLFYAQLYDALYERHNLYKQPGYTGEKLSGLRRDEFERLLRFVGFYSIVYQKIDYSEQEFIQLIDIAKEETHSKEFDTVNYIYDLIHSVPLFIKEGLFYKWIHKSISEYYAIQYLSFDAMGYEEDFALRLYKGNQNQNINLFELYYSCKPEAFNQYLLLPALKAISQELLPQEQPDVKLLFTSRFLGYTMHISRKPTDNTIKNEKLLDLGAFSFYVYISKNDTSKWHTILEILYKKKPDIIHTYNKSYSKISSRDDIRKITKNILKDKDDLIIDSKTILKIPTNTINQLLIILNYFREEIVQTMRFYITKEDCNMMITKIQEIDKSKFFFPLKK